MAVQGFTVADAGNHFVDVGTGETVQENVEVFSLRASKMMVMPDFTQKKIT